MPSAPSAPTAPAGGDAVVVGRYAGVVDVLAGLLADAGTPVRATAAVDAGGVAAVALALAGGGVAVVTAAPGDPTAALALDGRPAAAVVAVTWHPADERPALPDGVRIVPAGRIRADLAAVVAAALAALSSS